MAELEEDLLLEQITNKLEDLNKKQVMFDRQPFRSLKIDDGSKLDEIEGREICGNCFKSRKFFCYTCYTPVIDHKYFPKVKLPVKIDIIKHAREIDGKSTAIHAAILAPDDVKIYTYPDFPEFDENDRIVLVFPGKNAISLRELFHEHELNDKRDDTGSESYDYPITRAVFIDSTWNQTKSIYKDERLRKLPCVTFNTRISQFWRHQKKSPRWYLATIEAVHQFLVELHDHAHGSVKNYALINTFDDSTRQYCGQYDNLLFIFKYIYDKIHEIYDHDKLKACRRPLY